MADNIKLPPISDDFRELVHYNPNTDDIIDAVQELMREAVRLNSAVPDEPNWRHPKIQALIGSDARKLLQIDLIWSILEDPNQEFGPSDMEYWDTIHDKLKVALSTKPAAQPLTDEQIHKLLTDADEGQESAEYAVAVIRAVEQAHGIGVKND